MAEPKIIAGLHCHDVLEALDDYLDGALPAETVANVEEHLAACRACAEFGGRYGALVDTLHTQLSQKPATPSSKEDAQDAAHRALSLLRKRTT